MLRNPMRGVYGGGRGLSMEHKNEINVVRIFVFREGTSNSFKWD